MLDSLVSGKLIRDVQLKTSAKGAVYCQFLLSVSVGDTEPVIISGVAFGEVAERIAKLGKGDALAVIGSLKPTSWEDKTTGETKHGLSITANNSLSPYDIKKRRAATEQPEQSQPRPRPQSNRTGRKDNGFTPDYSTMPTYPEFNDKIPF
ncbi:single-stranded DNA-binding protein [Crenothrix sp.]|uniref:single-stranded DNA-binding protein n=1 Tax=Crenothrix sp. TaxID=3100433 RepID=UPI00374CC39C